MFTNPIDEGYFYKKSLEDESKIEVDFNASDSEDEEEDDEEDELKKIFKMRNRMSKGDDGVNDVEQFLIDNKLEPLV